MPYDSNKNELEILKYWDEHKCFEKSVSERPENNPYVFYDGPPFATGLPHYGHIVASLIKDVVPRYWTMRGYRVERTWGWDCHGLPVENIIEKKLNLNSRKEILNYGIDNFNEACRSTVLTYVEEWKKTIKRMGRWVDMENDYKTMDLPFMESVWWVFKELWKKDLIYKGHKAMHICPRCVTPLSNFEVTQGYKDVKDISVIAKFRVLSSEFREGTKIPENTYMLAWTTTPWTLPGNVLLAVGKDIDYVIVKSKDEYFVCAKERLSEVFKSQEKEQCLVISTCKGSDLVDLLYEPLFSYFSNTPNAFRIVQGDFVSTKDGTGIVHIAPAFGEDDYAIGKQENVPLVQHVTMEGKFVDEVTDFPGMDVKPKDDSTKTDVEIIKWLAHSNKLFSKEKFEHSYPHCWRCDTPLLNYATVSWFVKVSEMRELMLNNNEQINWVPEHIKQGRFGLWLEGARDWAISRNRYWGTPLPVWECQGSQKSCDHTIAIGSVEELENLTGLKIEDLHKHKIDDITFVCEKCGGEMRRIPEVLDCWFESGSMPYGQMHYPFENKEKFEAGFPAEFIAEGQDQTRGWFYTLHVLATALTGSRSSSIPTDVSRPAFKNVVVNGIVLAEDGKKMSKRLKNYPEPNLLLEKYGADAVRYYLVTSPVMEAESLNFSEIGVREMYNKLVNTLWNVVSFFEMYGSKKEDYNSTKFNVLDKWILAKLDVLVRDITRGMENYELVNASRPILEFINELSTWYVRRSRDRFKGDNSEDVEVATAVLHEVLITLSKVMAPFTPFIAEKVYLGVTQGKEKESVHLEEWPVLNDEFEMQNAELLKEMDVARKVVEMGLALRAEAGVKVRQPISKFSIFNFQFSNELKDIIAEELNVKEITNSTEKGGKWIEKEDGNIKVSLDIELTPELKKEGLVREIVRTINQMRKEQKLTIQDFVVVGYETSDEILNAVFEEYRDEIKKGTLAVDLKKQAGGNEVKLDEMVLKLSVEK